MVAARAHVGVATAGRCVGGLTRVVAPAIDAPAPSKATRPLLPGLGGWPGSWLGTPSNWSFSIR